MSGIIEKLVQLGLSKNKEKKLISIRYIHIFYEGEVTELELINLFSNNFSKYKSVLSFFELSPIHPATTSYIKITEILEDEFYYDEKGLKKYIMNGDFILFIRDFDVFFNVHNDYRIRNVTRIESEIRKFNEFLIDMKDSFSDFNEIFFVVPSFPSIEYAIALGLDGDLSKIECRRTVSKEEIFKWFDFKIGSRISRNRKSFKSVFYDSKLFDVNNLYKNALEDRSLKQLPNDLKRLKEYLYTDNFTNLLRSDAPFTYLDCVFTIILNIIKNLDITK